MATASTLMGVGVPGPTAERIADGVSGPQTVTGDITFTTSGNHVKFKTGTRCGTFTANGTTNVTVNTTAASQTMVVLISIRSAGGTRTGLPYVDVISPGVSFQVKSFAGDTSEYNWVMLETNAP